VGLDQEGLATADVDRDAGRELPVGLGVLGLGDQLPLVPVEGERAELGGPLDGARVGAEEDHVVAALTRHGDVDAAHLQVTGSPVTTLPSTASGCVTSGRKGEASAASSVPSPLVSRSAHLRPGPLALLLVPPLCVPSSQPESATG